jgi:hypothetical protein
MHTIYNKENLRDEKNIQHIDFLALFVGRPTPLLLHKNQMLAKFRTLFSP